MGFIIIIIYDKDKNYYQNIKEDKKCRKSFLKIVAIRLREVWIERGLKRIALAQKARGMI